MQQLLTDASTQGRSPKATLAAALVSSLGTIASILIAWQLAGAPLDRAGLAGAATGIALALIAYGGAWLGSTGTVALPAHLQVTPAPPAPDVASAIGPANDTLIGDLEAKAQAAAAASSTPPAAPAAPAPVA